MPQFIRDPRADLAIATDNDDIVALTFFRGAGGYSVIDLYSARAPIVYSTLPEALNVMLDLATKIEEKRK